MELASETIKAPEWSARAIKKRFGGNSDNKQEEEVWEVSPSSKPEGGPEKGRKQGEKSKK